MHGELGPFERRAWHRRYPQSKIPPVNALSPGVPEGILEGVKQFGEDDSVGAIVLIGGGRTFSAGADIKEFGKITSGQKRRGAGADQRYRAP